MADVVVVVLVFVVMPAPLPSVVFLFAVPAPRSDGGGGVTESPSSATTSAVCDAATRPPPGVVVVVWRLDHHQRGVQTLRGASSAARRERLHLAATILSVQVLTGTILSLWRRGCLGCARTPRDAHRGRLGCVACNLYQYRSMTRGNDTTFCPRICTARFFAACSSQAHSLRVCYVRPKPGSLERGPDGSPARTWMESPTEHWSGSSRTGTGRPRWATGQLLTGTRTGVVPRGATRLVLFSIHSRAAPLYSDRYVVASPTLNLYDSDQTRKNYSDSSGETTHYQ